MFAHVRTLARLRKERKALRGGALQQLLADDTAYVYARIAEDDGAVVAFNAAGEPRRVDLPFTAFAAARLRDALGGGAEASLGEGRLRATLAPHSAAVYVPGP